MVAAPPFFASVVPVTTAELGASWQPGCPVGAADLRTMRVSYWGFDGARHIGAIVVNRAVTGDVKVIFRALYRARFPIRRMDAGRRATAAATTARWRPTTPPASTAATPSRPGPKRWSVHAYGEAIDVNTVENPYLEGGRVLPPAGAAVPRPSRVRPGMAVAGGVLVRAFASAGWLWGGRWTASPDWQHFSKTGGSASTQLRPGGRPPGGRPGRAVGTGGPRPAPARS